jgi:hypothetical protein
VNRKAARVDENQGEIVRALQAYGCTTQSLASVGLGCPDQLIGYRGVNILMEIKNPEQDPNKRKLTPDQRGWHERWRGQKAVVETIDEALDVVRNIAASLDRTVV